MEKITHFLAGNQLPARDIIIYIVSEVVDELAAVGRD
jgi:hypothetical protein